jgi:DNA-binding NarL/FixJ family response regulator
LEPIEVKKVTEEKIRILIADDHVTVREGLAAIIGRQHDMTVVGEAADGREAVNLWQTHEPDVLLLDRRMPVLDGVGGIEEIRRKHSSARVLMLTTLTQMLIFRGRSKPARKAIF